MTEIALAGLGWADLQCLIDALNFAAEKHRHQRRKDVAATPYVNHPIALLRVLAIEAEVFELPVLVAALLHDTLEDTRTTPGELHAHFGALVRDLVLEVSDDKSLPKAERKRRQILHAPELSPGARLIKLADKICNLRDAADHPPADWDRERLREYFDWAAEVVKGVRGTHATLERLFDQAHAQRP